MRRQLSMTAALSATAMLISGCSVWGAASTALMVAKNVKSNRLGIRIWMDDHEAKRNELKQAVTGYSRWKIKEDVSTAPTLKFEFKDPGALGRISTIIVSIHQKFEAKYSDHAEFTIVATDSSPSAQMKPGTEYDLGALGDGFKILNWENKEVDGVELKPGVEYQFTISVKADDSESALIFIKTS
ncbi:MAG: hypothetical protein IH986_11625 [Planctomycetes bacterium]|nr:hypothetical protein [Planctomycetota bacterium]